MRISKRSSAAKARTAVQELSLKDPAEDVQNQKYSKNRKESLYGESVVYDNSQTESESISSDEEPELSEAERVITEIAPLKRVPKSKGEKKKTQYIKLTDFETYGPDPNSINVWEYATKNARPQKRGKKSKKNLERYKRPPTDLIKTKQRTFITNIPQSLCDLVSRCPEQLSPFNSSCQNSKTKLFVNETCLTVDSAKSSLDQNTMSAFCKQGDGAITGLSWCYCCGQYLASSAYPSLDFQDKFFDFSVNDSQITIWKLKEEIMELSRVAYLHHKFGVVRKLEWYPFSSTTSSILAIAFSNGSTYIFYIPLQSLTPNINLEELPFYRFENSSTFSWTSSPAEILVGSFIGSLSMWNLSEEIPCKTMQIALCKYPINSISLCPSNSNLAAVGSYEQSIFVVDLSRPNDVQIAFSLLSITLFCHSPAFTPYIDPIPNVRWIDEGIFFWDTDQTLRLLQYSPPSPTRQNVIFNFNCALSVQFFHFTLFICRIFQFHLYIMSSPRAVQMVQLIYRLSRKALMAFMY